MQTKTKKDYSYGVVPVREENGKWLVFLIHQIPRRGTLFWTFPKGHPEEGETQIDTALRELKEEAGIVPQKLATKHIFVQQYSFMYQDTLIEKKVEYYVGYVDTDVYTVQAEEVKEAGWFSFDEARKILTHDIARALLDDIEVYLQSR